jgi:hypothetical protein
MPEYWHGTVIFFNLFIRAFPFPRHPSESWDPVLVFFKSIKAQSCHFELSEKSKQVFLDPEPSSG